jgi:geranylgeranyl pyrophosphate synthase
MSKARRSRQPFRISAVPLLICHATQPSWKGKRTRPAAVLAMLAAARSTQGSDARFDLQVQQEMIGCFR